MITLRKGLILAGTALAVGWALCYVPSFFAREGKEYLDRIEVENHGMKIRVTSYLEKYTIVPGANYVFEFVNTENDRKEILRFRHDDPVAISQENIVLASDNLAYVFMGLEVRRYFRRGQYLENLGCGN